MRHWKTLRDPAYWTIAAIAAAFLSLGIAIGRFEKAPEPQVGSCIKR